MKEPALNAQQAVPAEMPNAGSALWDRSVCDTLIEQLADLRSTMLAREAELQQALAEVLPRHRDSARNLIHYLCLRAVDLRTLQDQLAWLGLSSLGRSESHVLANLDKVLGLLHRLTARDLGKINRRKSHRASTAVRPCCSTTRWACWGPNQNTAPRASW